MASSADQPSRGASVIDVLDRVLDKGIVIDAWMKVSLVGIDLLTVEARVLVASIETYLQHAQGIPQFDGALGHPPPRRHPLKLKNINPVARPPG
jgi:hypothetical protein